MNATSSNTVSAIFYDGRSPLGLPVTLIWAGQAVKVVGAVMAQGYPTHRLSVSPRIGKTERFVMLPDGGQLQCRDHPLLDRLPQEGKTEGIVAWLEQRWYVALAAVMIVVISLAAGYVWGLPAAADRIAAAVPIDYERTLGDHAIRWLDDSTYFDPTELDEQTQQALQSGFEKLTQGLPMQQHYRLAFRNSETIGANALALPGGTIVVTDQLVELAELEEEILAILAHEIGHVERRHALRHILHDSITGVVAATVSNDASSLTLVVSGMPVLLAKMKYSREFEAEADDYGFDLLNRHNISPEHFATMMERLRGDREGKIGDNRMSFLSTHPVTADRIAKARRAAERTYVPEQQ